MRRLRPQLTYSNVVATLALFVALGGSSWAAIKISGKNVRDGSLTGRDIKRNSIGSKPIKESRLGTVPNAETVGGQPPARFLIRCPVGTFPTGGTCIEQTPRPASSYGSALLTCQRADDDKTAGRRLPTHGELSSAYSRVDPAPGGELTGHVYPAGGDKLNVLIVTNKGGGVGVVENSGDPPNIRPFRCAIDPLN